MQRTLQEISKLEVTQHDNSAGMKPFIWSVNMSVIYGLCVIIDDGEDLFTVFDDEESVIALADVSLMNLDVCFHVQL